METHGMTNVGEKGILGLDFFNHFKGLLQIEVRMMTAMMQCVDNEHIDTAEKIYDFALQKFHIGEVSQPSKTESQDIQLPMQYWKGCNTNIADNKVVPWLYGDHFCGG